MTAARQNIASGLSIGALANAADVGVETIRYYQRRGLLAEPKKPYGGIRRYDEADLGRVRFIKSAQRLGFSLDEVAELLELEDGTHCNLARHAAERKLLDVRAKLADLHSIESALSQLVRRCKTTRGAVRCPLTAALHQH